MRLLNKWLATAALTTAGLSSTTHAQTPLEDFLARVEAQQINTAVITQPIAAPSIQTMMGMPATAINLDVNALFSLPDFQLELPGLENFYAVKEQIKENSLGGDNWIGDVVFLDPTGYSTGIQGRAYFIETANGITGTINTADSVIQIYPDGAGGQVVVTEDPSFFDNDEVLTAADGGEGEVAASPSVGGRRDGPNVATVANPYTIDVLWVTTQLARDSGADIPALIELATTTGNDVLVNSEVPAQLRVVGIHDNTTYVEDSGDMSQTLSDLRNTSDGHMDEIHQIRTDLGADMVAAVSGATNYCGIAYLDTSYASTFSVNSRSCMSGYTPIHEFGHNFGAQHDIANAGGSSYSFGYGLYNNTDDPYWRTVMSYSCPGGGCSRIPYFSNSQLTYNSLPLGDPEDTDNARVLRVRVAEVAGFAASAPSCIEHTATNSTHVNEGRAYTETVLFTTNYYAVGSEEQISGYSFSNTTVAEAPAGYFTPGNCGTSTPAETQFAPEVQNLVPTAIQNGLRLEGEVFDANADTVSAVRIRESGTSTWTNTTITGGTNFSVEIAATLTGNISVDVQTEDSEGNTFDFSTSFDINVGEAPIIELNGSSAMDDQVRINGATDDPDNAVNEIYYQIDGAGDPDLGTWTLATVDSTYWQVIVDNLSVGSHTIHLFGLDETAQRSNVISVQGDIFTPTAPDCVLAEVSPSQTRVAGEFEASGIMSDVNFSDITLEYRVNSGAWTQYSSFSNVQTRGQFFFQLPGSYTDGSTLTVEMRATDSSSLQSSCGSKTVSVNYPSQDLAPSCEIVDVDQFDGAIRFWMTVNDANGDMQQMFSKNSTMTEWVQTWPGPISTHLVPIPNFGSVTVNGRVLDATGLEGLCDATITVVDTQSTPYITYASGFYSGSENAVLVDVSARDFDGDIVSVETREVGTSTWVAGTAQEDDLFGQYWDVDLGSLSNGDYIYEARVTDAGGRTSEIVSFAFSVEVEVAPTLDTLAYTQQGRTLFINGTMSDANGNSNKVWYRVDDGDWVSFTEYDEYFNFNVYSLSDGPRTIEVYVADTFDNRSASQFINIDIDPGVAPTITNVSYVITNNQVVFTITASDVDREDQLTVTRKFDGGPTSSWSTGSNTWALTWDDVTVGSHTAEFYVRDEFQNYSATETVNFVIEDQTPCFEDTNTNHETAGRAYSVEVCSYELLGTCYGTLTTTWYAQGSDTDLGTNGSTVTSLVESSTGYYELGACNDTVAPIITLLGDNPMTVYQGQAYSEAGATATDNIDGTFNVSNITGTVDTSIVGTYTVDYNATDSSGNAAATVTRTVNVIADDVKPVITIVTGTSYSVNVNGSFTNPVPTATDNVDGDISANVAITGAVDTATVGTYYLYYNVSDAANNTADEVVVTVEVTEELDTTPPVITLTGASVINLTVGDSYSEPGYSATDNMDGDITTNVVVAGDVVDPNTVGTYVVTYNVTDAAGNAATQVTRTVNVDPVGGACFTDTIDNHVTAGRAEVQFGSNYYTVVPAGQTATYLGSTVLNGGDVISLEETAPGHWLKVTSCN
ncbi:MAG: DUF5011 domain-containing protein [Agarilytica sp.]